MKRHLIWNIAGTAAIGLAVPAFAAVGPGATPDDNGTPGEVRGNCDEAEHAGDPDCLTVAVPAPAAAVTPATAATIQVTVPSSTKPATVPSNTVPDNTVPAGTAPANTVPDNTTVGTAPSNTVNSVPGDISGPCDEAEHANDPRCTGAVQSDDNSGHDGGDDDSGHHSGGDDDSGHHGGGDDDNSGHGSDD
jgi:hypothetical protein